MIIGENMSKKSRDVLLNAAYQEFWVKGYNGTSVDSILIRAKLPKGSFYYHFKSKEDLVISVINERIVLKMKNQFTPAQEGDKIDNIVNAIRSIAMINELLMYGCPLNKLIRELLPQNEPEINKALMNGYKEIKKLLVIEIDTMIEENVIKFVNSNKLVNFILATTWGALSLGENPIPKESFLDTIEILHSYMNSLRQ